MSTVDDRNGLFPEGFEHVEGRLDETLHQVEQIDNQLKTIPKERGPQPIYRPPYYVGGLIPGKPDRTRIALQEKQHELKLDTLAKTEADTRNAGGRDGRVVRDTVRESLFPNPYRQMKPTEREQERHTIKEIEQSQDFMDAQLVARAAQREVSRQYDNPVEGSQNKAALSMSTRFSMSLSFTNVIQKTDGPSGKSRERGIEPDKG